MALSAQICGELLGVARRSRAPSPSPTLPVAASCAGDHGQLARRCRRGRRRGPPARTPRPAARPRARSGRARPAGPRRRSRRLRPASGRPPGRCRPGPVTTCTSSQPSSPHWSRICLVACTISGTVAYSHGLAWRAALAQRLRRMRPMATPHPTPSRCSTRAAPAAARDRRPTATDPAQVYDVRLPGGRRAATLTVVVVHGGFWQPEFDRAHAAAAVTGVRRRRLHRRRAGVPPGRHAPAAAGRAPFDDVTRPRRRGPRRPRPPGPPRARRPLGRGPPGGVGRRPALGARPRRGRLAGRLRRPDPDRDARAGRPRRPEPDGRRPRAARCARRTPWPTRPGSPPPCRWSCCTATQDETVPPEVSRSYAQRMQRPGRPPRRGAAGDAPRRASTSG